MAGSEMAFSRWTTARKAEKKKKKKKAKNNNIFSFFAQKRMRALTYT